MITMSEKELWQAALEARTERMAKLVKLHAPPYIIASEMVLVLKAVAGFTPEQFGIVLSKFMQEAARGAMNRCRACGDVLPQMAEDWCLRCMTEAAIEEEADEQ